MAYYIDQSPISPSATAEQQWIENLLTSLAPMTNTNSYGFGMNMPMQETEFTPNGLPGLLGDNSLFLGSSGASTVSSTPPIKEEDWEPCLGSDSAEFLNSVSNKLLMMQQNNNLTPKALESIFDTKEVLKESISENSPETQPRLTRQTSANSSRSSSTNSSTRSVSGTQKKKRCPRKRLTESQKEAHNKVEKKYRVNINSKINSLQTVIPWFSRENNKRMDLKVNKLVILEKAFDYIVYLQRENEAMRKSLERQ